MEIVLIRHGQPKWVDGDQYDLNPGLTELERSKQINLLQYFLKIALMNFGYRH